VDELNLTQNQLLLAISAGSFLIGAILMRLFARPANKSDKHEDPRNHQIRGLEADLRGVRRQLAEAEEVLETRNEEFNTAAANLHETRTNLIDKEEEVELLNAELKLSVIKTRELRQELQDHASETIRGNVRAQEAETELEVARAGSEAVLSEIGRLQEERQEMTNTMRRLEENMLSGEEMFGEEVDK